MRRAPQVRDYMTRLPAELEECDTVGDVEALLANHAIHHVPVLKGARLVGIVSERDLSALRATLGDRFEEEPLENVCTRDVATVSPVDPVTRATQQMLERGIGSVVVVDQEFVVGIFTTTDALRLISEVFHE